MWAPLLWLKHQDLFQLSTAKGACVLERVTGPQVPTHTCVLERVTGMGRGNHPYLCPGKSDWYGWWLPKILYFLPVLPSNREWSLYPSSFHSTAAVLKTRLCQLSFPHIFISFIKKQQGSKGFYDSGKRGPPF